MNIDKLNAVLPPPSIVNRELDWLSLELELGINLPGEYKLFIDSYGVGGIDGFIWLYGPFEPYSNLNFLTQMKSDLSVYSELKKQFPKRYDLTLYPEVGGVLPFGTTENGDTLFWLTEGDSDSWKIIVHDVRSPEYEVIDLQFIQFLTSLMSKEIKCKIFPNDFPDDKPTFDVVETGQ